MIRIEALETAPLRPHLAVISAAGFLGRIRMLEDAGTAWVDLLGSPDLALGVEIERSGLLAVLRPRGGSYVLDLVARDEDVRPGDRIITSGIAEVRDTAELGDYLGVMPRGLPVGNVAAVGVPLDRIFKEVVVEPLADARYLETVFVVLTDADTDRRTATGERRP
jgi:rod shape-determining protein MreC